MRNTLIIKLISVGFFIFMLTWVNDSWAYTVSVFFLGFWLGSLIEEFYWTKVDNNVNFPLPDLPKRRKKK
jgi:hypothetical protein